MCVCGGVLLEKVYFYGVLSAIFGSAQGTGSRGSPTRWLSIVAPAPPFRIAKIRRAKKERARHWHRDCPNGGKERLSAYSFSSEDVENSVLAARFQGAIDNDNSEEFDALRILAGGFLEKNDLDRQKLSLKMCGV
ncbi:hypothetical protein CYMTET_11344 [Cymbomonas tetramitiformis]|uniref:Uncharacterized protein n=1 Tax=Cymbomonas tetramitiformis TaxID=36881 RepID=A0AAE0GMH8_9CHLO|nr:hypothetical protein CYMTET_11344 [Cymbomonas tetramitiformis]